MTTDDSTAFSIHWIRQPKWLFAGGSVCSAIVALAAEGSGSFVGAALLLVCVGIICCWSFTGKPTLEWSVVIVCASLLLLGWTVTDPEPALFQSILIMAAVGWRIDRLSTSIGLLVLAVLVPLAGIVGQGDDHWGWWNWSLGTVFTWAMGRVIRLLGLTLDELTAARTKIVDLAARDERRRISRDVHDLMGHTMTAMLLNVRAAQRSLRTNIVETEQALSDAEKIGRLGMADIRETMFDLHEDDNSTPGDALPLVSIPDGESIKRLLDGQRHINTIVNGDLEQLNGPMALALFRVLQECVTNISRHCHVSEASIRIDVTDNEIQLLSENALSLQQARGGSSVENSLGLVSMRERISSLGGTFSAAAEGDLWRVRARIPKRD